MQVSMAVSQNISIYSDNILKKLKFGILVGILQILSCKYYLKYVSRYGG